MQVLGHVSRTSSLGTSTSSTGRRQSWLLLPTCAIAAPQPCQELVVAEEAHPLGTRLPREDEDLGGTAQGCEWGTVQGCEWKVVQGFGWGTVQGCECGRLAMTGWRFGFALLVLLLSRVCTVGACLPA